MDSAIKIIVHRSNMIFDIIIVKYDSAIRCEGGINEIDIEDDEDICINSFKKTTGAGLVCLNKKKLNSYFVSAYIELLLNSKTYHRAAFRTLLEFLSYKIPDRPNVQTILVRLRTPKKQFLDYKWNDRVTQLALERREVDYAMSWLSTLGGAFSALGEEFQYCAEMAGKISIKQFELALRLGDPILVARCKLYAALSLIQRGRFRIPKKIVRNVYKFALAEKDIRLQNMCQGIWAKLKYCYTLKKEANKYSNRMPALKKEDLFEKK